MGKTGTRTSELAGKQVFTTGEAAEICNVSQQTIIRCFDKGRLNGFRVPGSRFRRIPREDLIAFMHQNGIPADALGNTGSLVLLVEGDGELAHTTAATLHEVDDVKVHLASTAFDAGTSIERLKPGLVVIGSGVESLDPRQVCHWVRENEAGSAARIIVFTGTNGTGHGLHPRELGADAVYEGNMRSEEILGAIHAMAGT
jgi:excisionase family DNA binding protein